MTGSFTLGTNTGVWCERCLVHRSTCPFISRSCPQYRLVHLFESFVQPYIRPSNPSPSTNFLYIIICSFIFLTFPVFSTTLPLTSPSISLFLCSRSSHWASILRAPFTGVFFHLVRLKRDSVSQWIRYTLYKTKYQNPVNDVETLNNAPSTAAINFQIRAVLRTLTWNDVPLGRSALFTLEQKNHCAKAVSLLNQGKVHLFGLDLLISRALQTNSEALCITFIYICTFAM